MLNREEYYKEHFKSERLNDLNETAMINFENCIFEDCDLSMVDFRRHIWSDVSFIRCQMSGAVFTNCKGLNFTANFMGCDLRYSIFVDCSMIKTRFEKCRIIEAKIADANLSEAVFYDCDFAGTTFQHVKLQKADLRNSINFIIDPTTNMLRGAHFSRESLEGLVLGFRIKIE